MIGRRKTQEWTTNAKAEPRAEVQFSLVKSKFVHFFAIIIKAHMKTEFSLALIIIFFSIVLPA